MNSMFCWMDNVQCKIRTPCSKKKVEEICYPFNPSGKWKHNILIETTCKYIQTRSSVIYYDFFYL
ncbi:hypothetical protein RND71_015949 [Anisodus tanguticus]|uniref:Uncharacterized protein n=1 Tax=Anisodus tanguticus TaxID=243964 RepID=A0AAE1S790_9SOLA|nr:hypothetical protein RND71_015949 [Anisodus tanguticus]